MMWAPEPTLPASRRPCLCGPRSRRRWTVHSARLPSAPGAHCGPGANGRILLLLLLVLHSVQAANWDGDDDDDTVATINVEAVLGRTAKLPCNITANTPDDRVYMVMWYRQSASSPLYSFDVRARELDKARQYPDKQDPLGQRAQFDALTSPAALSVESVGLEDAGVYRCRVDFSNSATRNSHVNLTVIVPPRQMIIYDSSGKEVKKSIGPLMEGDNLVLKCEVRGGQPPPTVSWFANDRLIEGNVDATKLHVIVNRLDIHKVRRENFNTSFRCQASNTRLIQPISHAVTLDMSLKPLSVRILERSDKLVADKQMSFTCVTRGSRPQATLTWWKDEHRFKSPHIDVYSNDTLTQSILRFTPKAQDNGATLRCHADNPSVEGSSLEDILNLNVVHPPVVSLNLGKTLNPSNIKEGDGVYLDCSIRANPEMHRIAWFHNGNPVSNNRSGGIVFSSTSLVLQTVSRHQAGNYTCLATNERGNTTSQAVPLRIKYAPVCQTKGVETVGAALHERLRIRCRVDADPSDGVLFFWQFNNSGESSFDVPQSRLGPAKEELQYTTSSERDYGTLACWASNEVGQQAEPCVFRIVRASTPGPVSNCSVLLNSSSGLLEINCVAGPSGGLPQWFTLMLLEPRSNRVLFNATTTPDAEPVWSLEPALLAGAAQAARGPFSLIVCAHNQKGPGPLRNLDDKLVKAGVGVLQLPELVLGTGSNTSSGMVPVAALLAGALLTLALAALAAVVVAVRRRQAAALGLSPGPHDKVGHKCASPSRRNSSLEINDGDQRYLVSFTLKTAGECKQLQPDILNTPRAVGDGPPLRPDTLFKERDATNTLGRRHNNPSSTSPNVVVNNSSVPSPPERAPPPAPPCAPPPVPPAPIVNGSLRRSKGHFIATSIPGPESCV